MYDGVKTSVKMCVKKWKFLMIIFQNFRFKITQKEIDVVIMLDWNMNLISKVERSKYLESIVQKWVNCNEYNWMK